MLSKLDLRGKEITALCFLGLALLLLLSLLTYHSSDPTLFTASGGQRTVHNAVGIMGANIAAILLVAMGVGGEWAVASAMVGELCGLPDWRITFEELRRALAPYTLDFVAELAKGDPDEPLVE